MPCAVWAGDDLVVTRIRADFAGVDAVSIVTRQASGDEIGRLSDVAVRPGQREILDAFSAARLRALPATRVHVSVMARDGSAGSGERTLAEFTLEHGGAFDRPSGVQMTSPATMPWYTVDNVADVPSPALLVYPERVAQNIRAAVRIVGDVRRLRPHLKTSKMSEVVRMHLDEGITRFKCATIAEAEMAARAGAPDVLLAYQPVGPNVARFVRLVQAFPATRFAAIVDDQGAIDALSDGRGRGRRHARPVRRSRRRHAPERHRAGPGAVELYRWLSTRPGLRAAGLHMYDGHVRGADVDARRQASDDAFAHVETMRQAIAAAGLDVPSVVVGGTPAFPFHAQRAGVECSPGTTVFWDAGYGATLPDLPFVPAAALLTRVISRPAANRLCLDLGHKAVAAENPHPRVVLFGLEDARAVGHSEEHLVLETDRAGDFPVGTAVYGVPWHVCRRWRCTTTPSWSGTAGPTAMAGRGPRPDAFDLMTSIRTRSPLQSKPGLATVPPARAGLPQDVENHRVVRWPASCSSRPRRCPPRSWSQGVFGQPGRRHLPRQQPGTLLGFDRLRPERPDYGHRRHDQRGVRRRRHDVRHVRKAGPGRSPSRTPGASQRACVRGGTDCHPFGPLRYARQALREPPRQRRHAPRRVRRGAEEGHRRHQRHGGWCPPASTTARS